jgi:hypothetical protein
MLDEPVRCWLLRTIPHNVRLLDPQSDSSIEMLPQVGRVEISKSRCLNQACIYPRREWVLVQSNGLAWCDKASWCVILTDVHDIDTRTGFENSWDGFQATVMGTSVKVRGRDLHAPCVGGGACPTRFGRVVVSLVQNTLGGTCSDKAHCTQLFFQGDERLETLGSGYTVSQTWCWISDIYIPFIDPRCSLVQGEEDPTEPQSFG